MLQKTLNILLPFIEETLPALFMAVMVLIIVADVIGRYALNNPIEGAGELTTALFLWVIFLGMAGAMRRHLHVNIDAVVTRLRPPVQGITYLAINLILGTGMLVLVPLAWKYAIENRRMILLLQLPYRYVYVVIAIGLLLVALHAFANTLFAINRLKVGDFQPPAADQDFGVYEDTRPLFELPQEEPKLREPEPA